MYIYIYIYIYVTVPEGSNNAKIRFWIKGLQAPPPALWVYPNQARNPQD